MSINAPLKDWAEATDDLWVIAEVAQRKIESVWDVVVAAGFIATHAEPADPHDAFKRMMRGEVIEWMAAPRRWFRALPEEVAREIEIEACAHMVRIAIDVINVKDHLTICRERDDLEGVCVLLRDRDMADRVNPALKALDEFVASRVLLIGSRKRDDVRLRRASLVHPGAWWC